MRAFSTITIWIGREKKKNIENKHFKKYHQEGDFVVGD